MPILCMNYYIPQDFFLDLRLNKRLSKQSRQTMILDAVALIMTSL